MSHIFRFPGAWRAVLLLPLLSACAQVVDLEERVEQSDNAITTEMDVKAALLSAEEVWGAAIRVVYEDGAIRLQGFVDDEEERERALVAAQEAVAVPVIDEMQIWAAAPSSALR